MILKKKCLGWKISTRIVLEKYLLKNISSVERNPYFPHTAELVLVIERTLIKKTLAECGMLTMPKIPKIHIKII
jgi:hypothetical protein